jgi:hypothetical protein
MLALAAVDEQRYGRQARAHKQVAVVEQERGELGQERVAGEGRQVLHLRVAVRRWRSGKPAKDIAAPAMRAPPAITGRTRRADRS